MRDHVKSLVEVYVENIHCSPLIYPARHAIIESYQIGQAWFPLGESMLTTPDNFPFFHLLDDDLQNELPHHLSRDGGEADQPVVPWVLLLALFEDWSDIGLSPVSGTSPVLQELSKMMESGSAMMSSSSLSTRGPMDLWGSRLLKRSLTQSFSRRKKWARLKAQPAWQRVVI